MSRHILCSCCVTISVCEISMRLTPRVNWQYEQNTLRSSGLVSAPVRGNGSKHNEQQPADNRSLLSGCKQFLLNVCGVACTAASCKASAMHRARGAWQAMRLQLAHVRRRRSGFGPGCTFWELRHVAQALDAHVTCLLGLVLRQPPVHA